MTDFADFSKLFAVKLPGVDAKVLFDAQSRNLDALVKSAEVVSKTVQSFFQRQNELFQANLTEAANHGKSVLAVKDPSAAINQQAAFVKKSAETLATQSRELSDIAVRGGEEVVSILRARVEAASTEAKSFVESFSKAA